MNDLVKQEPESGTVSLFERLARDPSVDVDKIQRLIEMQERANAKAAEAAFSAALSDMQCELPTVQERGNAAGRYTYALWEDINAAIKPILHKHGFALSFRTDFSDGIAVTAVLSHRQGHSERTTIKLPADKSGNKPDVQAVASSVSYGKRYTAGALLNLTSHGEDDDAFAAAGYKRGTEAITPTSGAWDAMDSDQQAGLLSIAQECVAMLQRGESEQAITYIRDQKLTAEETTAIWTRFASHERTAMKKAADKLKKESK